jgi:hypothetical protein
MAGFVKYVLAAIPSANTPKRSINRDSFDHYIGPFWLLGVYLSEQLNPLRYPARE